MKNNTKDIIVDTETIKYYNLDQETQSLVDLYHHWKEREISMQSDLTMCKTAIASLLSVITQKVKQTQ